MSLYKALKATTLSNHNLNQFQNTLMEANGMVYDVQAFPEADVPVISDTSNPETIYSPNVNP